MDRYKVVATRDGQGHITGYAVVDNQTGQRVKSWSSKFGEGEGVTRGRRMENAKARAEAWMASQSVQDPLKDKRISELSGGNVRYDDETGLYYTNDGKAHTDRDAAIEAAKELERLAGLEEDVSKFEERVTAAGKLREELAENVGARQQGQLMSQLRRSILATGGEQGQVEALVPQIQEGSQRSLQDYITGSQARTQEQLAEFIPTEIGAEYNQAQLADAMKQFLVSESSERAQIQAGFDAQPEWWESILGQGAQGVGQGAGEAGMTALLAALASDIRVKENISQVGTLDNGLPVYLFNYKGSQTPQIGLMAQDVEQVNEEAVVEINGIKHVYYAKAVK